MAHSSFRCNYKNTKKSLYKSFNSIFGEIGRYASADVIVHMLQAKCFPALLYDLDACPVNSTETKSFEFALFRVYAKLFSTTSKDIIEDYCLAFSVDSIAILINKRKLGFLARYSASLTEVCSVFRSEASSELRVSKSKLA